jgi:hypothetical protein
MLNSEPRNPQQIPCLLNFFLQHKEEAELYHKIIEVDNISDGWKYCIIMDDRQQSCVSC